MGGAANLSRQSSPSAQSQTQTRVSIRAGQCSGTLLDGWCVSYRPNRMAIRDRAFFDDLTLQRPDNVVGPPFLQLDWRVFRGRVERTVRSVCGAVAVTRTKSQDVEDAAGKWTGPAADMNLSGRKREMIFREASPGADTLQTLRSGNESYRIHGFDRGSLTTGAIIFSSEHDFRFVSPSGFNSDWPKSTPHVPFSPWNSAPWRGSATDPHFSPAPFLCQAVTFFFAAIFRREIASQIITQLLEPPRPQNLIYGYCS